MEIGSATSAIWQTPECPLVIEYTPAVLEEIRQAVMDAFFSLPRGGAEVGGILLGTQKDNRVRILASRPLVCEHASGPSFVLSPKDHARLAELLRRVRQDPEMEGLAPVGWYHSHTRSEIFLTEEDLQIHQQYFPAPWQVALVLRPASMRPTRAGFFFRGLDGSVHGAHSYAEFVVPGAGQAPARREPQEAEVARPGAAATQAVARAVLPLYQEAVSPLPASDLAVPSFLVKDAERPSRRVWPWIVLAALALATGIVYQTRNQWGGLFEERTPSLQLKVIERDGQLWIQWDRTAPVIQQGQGATIEIRDGASKLLMPLDTQKLRGGGVTYARRSEVVEVHLTVRRPEGRPVVEYAGFIGPPVVPKPTPQELEAQRQRDQLAREAERVRNNLRKQEQRTRQLERSLEEMRSQVRREEERRLQNQPNPPPQP